MTKISNLYGLTNYVTANSSGNVVIAAPTSGYALDVTGTGRFTGALASTNFILSGGTGNTGLYYGHTDRVVLANYTAGGIDFETNGGTINMTLFPSGNLGVGASLTDAGYKLDVAGTGRFTGALSGTSATFSGFVGIGASASYNLDVVSASDASLFQVKSTATANNTALRIGIDANTSFINATGSSTGILELRTYGTPKLTIQATGAATFSSSVTATNLSINTTSTSGRIDVQASGLSSFPIYWRNNNGGYGGGVYNTGGNNMQLYLATSAGTENVLIAASGSSYFMGGNVGIGTTSPTHLIHAVGTSNWIKASYSSSSDTRATEITYVGIKTTASTSQSNNMQITMEGGYTPDGSGSIVFNTGSPTATERMRIDSSGRVGINVTPSGGDGMLQITSYAGVLGDSTKRRSLSVFSTTAENSDQPGVILGYDTAGAGIVAARTNSSGQPLAFWTYNGSSWGERMRITSSGFVLIGTTAGDPVASNVAGIAFEGTYGSGKFSRSNNACIDGNRIGSDGELIRMYRGGTQVGNISVTGSSTSYNTSSDYRLKEDFKSINGLEIVNKIKVYDYKWKANDSRMDGVLAHELAEVLPYAVQGIKDGEQMQGVDYSKIVPVMVQAIKDLKAELDTLKNK